MTKEELMRSAIQNFHRVYYEIERLDNFGMAKLHHAAEHLFDAAEIESSVCEDGTNERLLKAKINQDIDFIPRELFEAWNKIERSHKK